MRLEITDVRTLTDSAPNVRELEFRGTPVTLGSGSDNLVQLPDVEIAAHHATLRPMGEYWSYEPRTRDGHTKLNGQPVNENAELHDGDVLEIRFFSLRVILDSELPVDVPETVSVGDLAKIKQFPLPPRSVTRKPDVNVTLNPARQKSLVDAMHKLCGLRDLATLLEELAVLLLRELSGRVVWIGVRKGNTDELEFVESRNEQGAVIGEPPNLEAFVYRCLNRQQFLSIPRTGHEDTQSVLAVPLLGARGALALVYLDTRKHTRVFDEGDLDYVTLLTRLITPMVEEFLERGALLPGAGDSAAPLAAGGSAQLVQSVREGMMRDAIPQWPQLGVAAFAKAGEEIAGDVYDVLKLPNGLAAILLAHVDGAAGRVAGALAQIRGAFRVAGLHADPPHVQLKALNWLLFDESGACRADAVVAIINPKTGAMEIANAGKLGVLLLDAHGQPRKLGNPQAPPLGLQKSIDYVSASARIDDAETLALFTRGCIKARKESGESIGEKRFLAALCTHVGQPASQAMEDLLGDVAHYFHAGRAPDDVTVILAHRGASEP